MRSWLSVPMQKHPAQSNRFDLASTSVVSAVFERTQIAWIASWPFFPSRRSRISCGCGEMGVVRWVW